MIHPVIGGGESVGNTAPQQQPTPEGTALFDEPITISTYEPGTQVQSGLTLLSSNVGMRDGQAYFYAMVRNDSSNLISQVRVLLHALDDTNYVVAEYQELALVTDIPPGQVITVGGSYAVPEQAVESANFVLYETEAQAYQGFFDLPVTVTFQGAGEMAAYVVRGTVDNTAGQTLYFPVIDVLLLGPDDQPVGLAHGVVMSQPPAAAWGAGVSAEFEAAFDFTVLDAQMIREVQVLAVGYVPVP